ncbi:MAG: hypothetical protein ACLQU6_12385 [Limisphaerales bacterium]
MGKKLLCVAGTVAIVVTGCGPKEPTVQGHNMVQWLQILRANTNSTENPLKLVQMIYDKKFEVISAEVAMAYNLLKEHDFLGENGQFNLIINGRSLSTYCSRATNGDCLCEFDNNVLNPGTNQIQVAFSIFKMDQPLYATGPITEFVSSNICRVNEHVTIDHFKGVAILWADLSIPNAIFNIELLDTNGNHIKIISGVTTNGVINERWDLIGDSGYKYTNDPINAVYHVMISNSPSETKTQLYNIEHP